MKNLTSQQMQVLKIAIGQELAEILSLKLNKAGLIPTRSEPKSIEGLGAVVLRIVEEQTQRVTE